MNDIKLLVNKVKGSSREYSCAVCHGKATYYDEYDTFACMRCDQWLDICNCGPNDLCPYPKPVGKPSENKR